MPTIHPLVVQLGFTRSEFRNPVIVNLFSVFYLCTIYIV